jgi:hypothetical protein
MIRKVLCGVALLMSCGATAHAALLSRAGGQAYYDTVLDITWLADANLAQTSGYDADGYMTWDEAKTWIDALNAADHLGEDSWRLPTLTPIDGGAEFDWGFSYDGSTDIGYNLTASGSAHPGSLANELAHLFYNSLANQALYNTSGALVGCGGHPQYCLSNSGPFSNLVADNYWTDVDFEYSPGNEGAWTFYFVDGYAGESGKGNYLRAWAVLDGDIAGPATVPIPAATWLFGGALGALGILKRRQKTAKIE